MKVAVLVFVVASIALSASAGQSVDLLTGRTLADFDCLLTDDKAAIARAYSISDGVMRVSGEVRAILVTKEIYRDFDLSFDMSYPEEGFGDGGIILRQIRMVRAGIH